MEFDLIQPLTVLQRLLVDVDLADQRLHKVKALLLVHGGVELVEAQQDAIDVSLVSLSSTLVCLFALEAISVCPIASILGFQVGNNLVGFLAAANRPESLDPAIARSGPFDCRVPVELPDLKGREAIHEVHAKKVKVKDGVDFRRIVRMASGTSGMELANIANEVALRAVRDGRSQASQAVLEESNEVVITGYQKKNDILTDHEKPIVAYHEIGHALVAIKQTNATPV